jgi:hypothetical protein
VTLLIPPVESLRTMPQTLTKCAESVPIALLDQRDRRFPPPTRRGIRLNTLKDVRRELARLYRDARSGTIATQDATRLAYLLDRLAHVIEGGLLEQRIEVLERKADAL